MSSAAAALQDAVLLDDPDQQGGYTRWATDAAGRRSATSQLQLSGMVCAACAGLIERALLEEPGVERAQVSYAAQRASVQWLPGQTHPSRLLAAIRRAGYEAQPDLAAPARALRQQEQRAALWRLFVAVFCTMQVMMYATPAYVSAPGAIAPDLLRLLQWASWLLSIPVLLFSAAPLFREAWAGLRHGQVRMDLPVVIGLLVAFIASSGATFEPGGLFGHEVYFDSLTMFVCFLLGARYLSMRASHRVAGTLEQALSRLPASVTRVEADGSFSTVAPGRLRAGDRLRVRSGEAFAADGRLQEGSTWCDEALLTGESRPVAKRPGDLLIAGSLNLGAPVTMVVERLGADTRLEAIVALMRGALTQRPALVQAADRIAVPFLWTVLLLAGAAAALWWHIDPARAVWVAVAVLVVTCPCALSLAAPSALLAAAGALAQRGVLVQRLEALEALARVDTLFFDKTGSLSDAALRLRRVRRLPGAERRGLDEAALLRLAGALARHSAHPLSQALVSASDGGAGAPAQFWAELMEQPGRGLQACLPDGSLLRLGAPDWVEPGGLLAADAESAQVCLGDEAGALACFEFDEAIRPDAAAALAALRRGGVQNLALLSGDAPARVARFAAELGIADAQGGATPEGKLARVAAAQGAGHCVGMVGDGLNDAPVIARADVSFAFAQGAALTQSRADFILLAGRVGDIAMARDTARLTLRVLRQNMAWALVYNAVSVPLALAGLFPPWAAGLGMAGSSVVVVLNSLRIRARPLPAARGG